jgi:phage baseplate assembly protein W
MTNKIARNKDYSDLDLDFLPHPTTKDVMRKTGIDSVKRSVRNLILTNFYDRPFRPYIGSNVQKLLFENANPLVEGFLRDAIKEVIENFEPRVLVKKVEALFDYDNNGYNVRIYFVVLNSSEPVVTTLFLERIR